MQRIKKTLYVSLIALSFIINPVNPVSIMSNPGPEEVQETTAIPANDQTAITKIKREQTEAGSVISEHVNEKENGQTTVKMLEIPERQLSDIIRQWRELGHEINGDTIKDEEFVKYIVNNADIKSFIYTAKVPKLFFLVKNKIAEPMLYGGEIKVFFKKISFYGWLKIAGVIDDQGNYQKGFEHLAEQKEELISIFNEFLSKTDKGSYTIVELYTDENGERKGHFKFFNSSEQATATFVQPIDAMAAFGLIYMNLVQTNPADDGVKEDLTKPIVDKLTAQIRIARQSSITGKEF